MLDVALLLDGGVLVSDAHDDCDLRRDGAHAGGVRNAARITSRRRDGSRVGDCENYKQ